MQRVKIHLSDSLCYSLACYGSQSAICSNISLLCSKYDICRYDVNSGIDCIVHGSYTRSRETDDNDIANRIKASVIRDMLNIM